MLVILIVSLKIFGSAAAELALVPLSDQRHCFFRRWKGGMQRNQPTTEVPCQISERLKKSLEPNLAASKFHEILLQDVSPPSE